MVVAFACDTDTKATLIFTCNMCHECTFHTRSIRYTEINHIEFMTGLFSYIRILWCSPSQIENIMIQI